MSSMHTSQASNHVELILALTLNIARGLLLSHFLGTLGTIVYLTHLYYLSGYPYKYLLWFLFNFLYFAHINNIPFFDTQVFISLCMRHNYPLKGLPPFYYKDRHVSHQG